MKVIRTEELTENSLSSSAEKLWVYNGLDCCVTLEVFEAIEPQLDNTSRATYEFSKALQGPILEMNMRGVLIDPDEVQKSLAAYETDIARLISQFNRLVNEGFGLTINPASPAQLKHLFYDVMRLPVVKKRNTQGGYGPSVDRNALEKLSVHFHAQPIIAHILAIRDLQKKISFLRTERDGDGRLRTSFNIAGTTTGRLASALSDFGTGTNLQNIDRRLRRVFIPDPGMKFCNVDLEQADSRNLGAMELTLFGDARYLDACESGDLHTAVCRMAWTELAWTGDPKADRKIADQIAYRDMSYRDLAKRLGHGCLTVDHEVLTRKGWVPITDKPNELLMWKEGESKFGNVSHWEDKYYTGELQHFLGNSIDALMTHDHRVPARRDAYTGVVKEYPASAGPQPLMPLGDGYVGGNVVVPARLIAAIMSDGYISSNSSTTFHIKKERKVQRLIDLCNLYKIKLTKNANDKYTVNFTHNKFCGSYMFNWTRECLEDFLDEYKFWDGTRGKSSVTLFSKNRAQLEWLQTFGRILGIGGAISKEYKTGFGGTCYRLQQNNRKWARGSSVKHTRHAVKNVRVLCPTVETGWFYVRRNGKIFVTGNTNYEGQPATMAMHSKIQVEMVKQFQLRYFAAFPAHQRYHQWIREEIRRTGQLTTLFGRRRYFFGRRDDPTVIREAVAYIPQSMTADEIDHALIRIWRDDIATPLLQVHDSILFQYPAKDEAIIIPEILKRMRVELDLPGGRKFSVPAEAKVGWNWADVEYDDAGNVKGNEYGLVKWRGADNRNAPRPAAISFLDRLLR
jgi:DNA polymerase I-like protein with 3'-5' exonuclease and polymerase domains